MIRNIIFDWSGTLVDDLPAVWIATNFVFQQAQVPELSLEEFRAEFCLPFKRFYDKFLPHFALPQLESWFHHQFRQCQDSVVPLPHAREFLQFCRAHGVRTFVLSSVHPEHWRVQAGVTGFGGFIDEPFVGVWDKRERIHGILEQHGLAAGETLLVGDMQHDMETARHGGVHSCAVLTGYNNLAQLRAAEPELVVEHLGELREILTRQNFEVKFGPSPSAPPARDGAAEGASAGRMPEGFVVRESNSVGGAREDVGAAAGRPVVTVGAVIFHARTEDVLMCRTHKWSGLWGIPGGKVRYGESCVEGLRRELKEETNLEVCDVEFVLVQDCIGSREFYREAHFVLLNYRCRAMEPMDVRLNEEAEEFRWVPLAEAMGMSLNAPTRVLLEELVSRSAAKGFAPLTTDASGLRRAEAGEGERGLDS